MSGFVDPGQAIQDAQVRLRTYTLSSFRPVGHLPHPLGTKVWKPHPAPLSMRVFFDTRLGWDPAQLSVDIYPLVFQKESEGVGETQEQEGEGCGRGPLKLCPSMNSA